VGFGDEAQNTVIELTCNWETHQHDLGNAFGHLALGVETFIKPAMTYGEKAQKLFANLVR
jgi:lactoylglutathione lyase